MNISFYTDGASRNNGSEQSIASCAWIGSVEGKSTLKGKGIPLSCGNTNNFCELWAIKDCLDSLKPSEDMQVTIHTDSNYAILQIGKARSGKLKAYSKGPTPNYDLIMQIAEKIDQLSVPVAFVKVEGHAGIELNEMADELCKLAAGKEEETIVFFQWDEDGILRPINYRF